MEITQDKLNNLTEIIEDTVEYFCDKEQESGEMVWLIVETLATTKLAELRGELTATYN